MDLTKATLVHREQQGDTLVEIFDEGDCRSLIFSSNYLQSSMSLSSPSRLVLIYTQYMMLSLLVQESPANVLLIGVGAGSLVRFLHHHFPACRIDAVDHSAHIIKLAHGYFRLPQNGHIHIHCQDGYDFLRDNHPFQQYDIILIDAFDWQGMSARIYSSQFFRLCSKCLSPDGVLCANLWSGEKLTLTRIKADLEKFFTGHLYIPVPERGNVIAYALPQPVPWNKINRTTKAFDRLRQHFSLNFQQMAAEARKHNLTLPQRLAALFS